MKDLKTTINEAINSRWVLVKGWLVPDTITTENVIAVKVFDTKEEALELLKRNADNARGDKNWFSDGLGFYNSDTAYGKAYLTFFKIMHYAVAQTYRWVDEQGRLQKLRGL